jgi:alanyl-tRNA synthetase
MHATERLYYRDSRVLAFEGAVLAVEGEPNAPRRVCLDRTAFYPEGGGQPADHGELAGARVIAVNEADGVIWHTIEGAVPAVGSRVTGRIDPVRRFDHMQQHSGQHLLSRVFVDQLGLDTTSFHLGVDGCSIDLATPGLTDARINAAEERAAELVRDARPVVIRIGDAAHSLQLRGEGLPLPDYRVISIDGFDDCACGGTHVATTAEIELIAIRRVERINESRCRVEFVCGGRARRDYRAKRERIRELSRLLSADEARLVDAGRALLEKQKDAEKRVRELTREALPGRVDRQLAQATTRAGRRVVVIEVPLAERADAAALAQEFAKRPLVLAALIAPGDAGGKGTLYCACGPESGVAAGQWLAAVLAVVGGRGGGSPHLAQGGFPAERGGEVLSAVERELQERLRD